MSGYSSIAGGGNPVFNNVSNLTVNGKPYRCTDEYNGWLITADDIKSSDGKTITQLIESVSNSNTTTNQTVSDLQNGLSGVNTNLSKIGTAISKIRTRLTAVEQLASTANSTASTAKNHAQLAYEKSQQALDGVTVRDVTCTLTDSARFQFDIGGVKSVGDIVYLQFSAKSSMPTSNGICEVFVLNDKRPTLSIWLEDQSATVDYSYMTAMGSRKVKRAYTSTIRVLYDGRVIIGNGDLFNKIKADGGTDIRLDSVKICFSYLAI